MADKVGETGSYLMEKKEIITRAIEKIDNRGISGGNECWQSEVQG
jgi:hypothetical protein